MDWWLFVCCDVCQESSVGTLEISLLRRGFLIDEQYHSIVHYKWLTPLYSREIKRFTSSSRVYNKQEGTCGFIPRILLYDTAKELWKWLKPQVKLLSNWKRTWNTSEVISVELDIESNMLFQINAKMWNVYRALLHLWQQLKSVQNQNTRHRSKTTERKSPS